MQRTCNNVFENPYFSRVSTIKALISITKEIAAIVLAIRMQSMREQWKLRRQMSQELCSVATNDARPIPARSCSTHIRVDDPRIPTLGIGGFCYEGNIVFDIPGISTNVSYDNMWRSQICAIRKTFCKQRKCRAS